MITTLLCIVFAFDLTFKGLTLPILFNWYCLHPILFIIAVYEIIRLD